MGRARQASMEDDAFLASLADKDKDSDGAHSSSDSSDDDAFAQMLEDDMVDQGS